MIDIGANIGYYTLLSSQIVGDTGRVYSIEASPTIFAELQRNLLLNHVRNVEAINTLVSDAEGDKEFWLSADSNTGHSTSVAQVGMADGMRLEGKVGSRTLLQLVPWERLSSARLIKVDVEGAERAVMGPLLPLLGDFSKRTIWAVELSPQFCPRGRLDTSEIFDAFSGKGYSAALVPNVYSVAGYLAKPDGSPYRRINEAPMVQSDVIFYREPHFRVVG